MNQAYANQPFNASAVDMQFNNSFNYSRGDGRGLYEASENYEEIPAPNRRERDSTSSKKQTKPADMPSLNLSAQNLLSGINERVANKMPKQLVNKPVTVQTVSDMSEMSKFTLDGDSESQSAPDLGVGGLEDRATDRDEEE